VKKFALVTVAVLLGACSKDIQNKQALKDGVVEYLNARMSQTGLDVSRMDVDVSGMTFERDQARATVVFRPKGSTEGGGMTMNYSFDRKGDKWVVHGRQDSSVNPHGAGGLSTLPQAGDDAAPPTLPPGHPPTSSKQ
jgi:hypothetical protein